MTAHAAHAVHWDGVKLCLLSRFGALYETRVSPAPPSPSACIPPAPPPTHTCHRVPIGSTRHRNLYVLQLGRALGLPRLEACHTPIHHRPRRQAPKRSLALACLPALCTLGSTWRRRPRCTCLGGTGAAGTGARRILALLLGHQGELEALPPGVHAQNPALNDCSREGKGGGGVAGEQSG
jgi:hypothetical protein